MPFRRLSLAAFCCRPFRGGGLEDQAGRCGRGRVSDPVLLLGARVDGGVTAAGGPLVASVRFGGGFGSCLVCGWWAVGTAVSGSVVRLCLWGCCEGRWGVAVSVRSSGDVPGFRQCCAAVAGRAAVPVICRGWEGRCVTRWSRLPAAASRGSTAFRLVRWLWTLKDCTGLGLTVLRRADRVRLVRLAALLQGARLRRRAGGGGAGRARGRAAAPAAGRGGNRPAARGSRVPLRPRRPSALLPVGTAPAVRGAHESPDASFPSASAPGGGTDSSRMPITTAGYGVFGDTVHVIRGAGRFHADRHGH